MDYLGTYLRTWNNFEIINYKFLQFGVQKVIWYEEKVVNNRWKPVRKLPTTK